jgi:hypothetical protein
MYLSRLNFHTVPGKTGEVEEQLKKLAGMVTAGGGSSSRVLRAHYSSLGSADIIFEQEAPDLATLEEEIKRVMDGPAFREWTRQMPGLLREPPKREVYIIASHSRQSS